MYGTSTYKVNIPYMDPMGMRILDSMGNTTNSTRYQLYIEHQTKLSRAIDHCHYAMVHLPGLEA